MKIENLERVISLKDEYEAILKQIETIKNNIDRDDLSFSLYEYGDSSGFYIGDIYYKGNVPSNLYKGILKDVLVRFEAHKELLLKELEEL